MLKWIFERCDGGAAAAETPIGRLPAPAALDTSGLGIPAADLQELLRVDITGWKEEIPSIRRHFETFGSKLPQGLRDELAALEQRLGAG